MNLKEVCENLQESYDAYEIIVEDCIERRVTFLKNLAAVKVKSGKMKAVSAFKKIERNEEQRAS